MGWLDRMIAPAFTQDGDGRDVFLPWGKFGKGRVIPSAADRAWVRRYLKIYCICIILTVPIVMIGRIIGTSLELSTAGILVGAIVCLIVAPLIPLRLCARAWPIAGDRELTVRDAMSGVANEMGPVFLWIGIVCGGIMVAASLFILVFSDETLTGALGAGFFGTCLGFLVWILRARRRR